LFRTKFAATDDTSALRSGIADRIITNLAITTQRVNAFDENLSPKSDDDSREEFYTAEEGQPAALGEARKKKMP
jgi:hypothetical protein